MKEDKNHMKKYCTTYENKFQSTILMAFKIIICCTSICTCIAQYFATFVKGIANETTVKNNLPLDISL